MTLTGEYEPSPEGWVREQVAGYEASGGVTHNTFRGVPVVVMTSRGARSGKLRKNPVMRVERGGAYALVASKGGSAEHPTWFHNLVQHPEIDLQDGPAPRTMTVRLLEGDERSLWWRRAVAVWPPYEGYQARTDRVIPVFLAEPV